MGGGIAFRTRFGNGSGFTHNRGVTPTSLSGYLPSFVLFRFFAM